MQDIRVPQMGEGLTEVRLLEFLKKPGETVRRDELIYTMETDKATLEVESPEAGILVEWLAEEGAVLPIGAPVARIQTAGEVSKSDIATQAPQESAAPIRSVSTNRTIPPRTRAYARELGISDQELADMPSSGAKLMPADLDAYRASTSGNRKPDGAASITKYADQPLPDRQRSLNFHMRRSAQIVIPGTVSRPVDWGRVRSQIAQLSAPGSGTRATEFQAFAYCVARTLRAFPKFFCSLVGDDTVRQYERLNLGVAVAMSDGQLSTAVVRAADLMQFKEFTATLHERVQSAREGHDQADSSVQVHLSYLGAYGIRDAIPVLVAPAVGVMFIGEPYADGDELHANLALTFDHRLINGAEAAEVLKALAVELRSFDISTLDPH